jgi:hypothetical protein
MLFCCLVTALTTVAQAGKWTRVTATTELKVGDKVQVIWDGVWVDGTVDEIDRTFKQVKVRFRKPTSGMAMNWPFDYHEMRIAKKNASPTKGNPFLTEREKPLASIKNFRTWVDDTGAFKIEAKFVEIKGDSVHLKNRKGEILAVPINRLSKADRDLILQIQKGPEEEEEFEFLDELPTARAHMGGVSMVYLSKDVDSSKLTPDGGKVSKKALTSQPIALPDKKHPSENTYSLYTAADSPQYALVPYVRSSEHDQPTRFVLCDLAEESRETKNFRYPVSSIAIGLGPSGDRVLSIPNGWGSGSRTRLDIWRVAKNKLRHELGWEPYQELALGRYDKDVKWAAFVDADHVATLSNRGVLVLWTLPDVRAVYSLQIAEDVTPVLSPGGKYLAFLADSGLGVIDAKSGQVKGYYPGASARGKLAFRPDGKQIALLSPKRLQVWEFAGGKLYRDIGLAIDRDHANRIEWPSANFILVNNQYLVDVEKYLIAWQYYGIMAANRTGGAFWCLTSRRNQVTMLPQPIPHKEALEVIGTHSAEEFRGIEPGTTVSLEMNVSAPSKVRERIERRYREQLESRGIKIAPGQPFKLVIATLEGKTETACYDNSRGRTPRLMAIPSDDAKIVRFKRQISRVAFLIDGKTAWERSFTVNAPRKVPLAEGETIELALKKYETPFLKLFDYVELPSYIAKPYERVSFGASSMTPNGPSSRPPRSRKYEQEKRDEVKPSGRVA